MKCIADSPVPSLKRKLVYDCLKYKIKDWKFPCVATVLIYVLHDPLLYTAVPEGYYEISFTQHTRYELHNLLKDSFIEQAVLLPTFVFILHNQSNCKRFSNASERQFFPPVVAIRRTYPRLAGHTTWEQN
jgi:hypothetical protein